jgi:hypothetical protein
MPRRHTDDDLAADLRAAIARARIPSYKVATFVPIHPSDLSVLLNGHAPISADLAIAGRHRLPRRGWTRKCTPRAGTVVYILAGSRCMVRSSRLDHLSPSGSGSLPADRARAPSARVLRRPQRRRTPCSLRRLEPPSPLPQPSGNRAFSRAARRCRACRERGQAGGTQEKVVSRPLRATAPLRFSEK